MHCLKNYNGKYIMYCVEHYILSHKILELHRVENHTTENKLNLMTQFRKLYFKITLCIKLYSNLGNYLKYKIVFFPSIII